MAKVVVRGGSECAERAERMNDWARGAMDIAADEATAHQVLEAKVCDRWTAIDLACFSEAKSFLSQRHCVSLYERWWHGSWNPHVSVGSQLGQPAQ